MAQLEKDITAERVKAGLRRAKDKENEKKSGRSSKKVNRHEIRRLGGEGWSLIQIAAELELSKNTMARHL